jgi:CRISPR-associated endonuclease Cas1
MATVIRIVDEPEDDTFTRDTSDQGVWTAHGYGIKITVANGQLVVSDGIGDQRRTRKLPKIDRQVRRIVITGWTGYISLEALSWCSDRGIAITMLDSAGNLTSSYCPDAGRTDGRLIRCQALSGMTGPYSQTGLTIARDILSTKVNAQASIIRELFGKEREAREIESYAAKIPSAPTMIKLREHEAHASAWYFGIWTGRVSIPWNRRDIDRVPVNWCNFPGRRSLISGKKQHATDPVNSLLNYCYTLGYAEARTACVKAGLDPRLGYFHNDDADRDSLALDILEMIRPEIDRFILGLLGIGGILRKFTPNDFYEPGKPYQPGTVRIVAPLTHELCEQSVYWSKTVEATTSNIVRTLLAVPANGRAHIRPVKSVSRINGEGRFSTTMSVRQIVSDRAWRKIKTVVPPREVRFGRTPIDERIVIAAIAWCEGNGVKYGKVPASLGIEAATLRRREAEWKALGAWDEIIDAIRENILS